MCPKLNYYKSVSIAYMYYALNACVFHMTVYKSISAE